MNQFCRKLDAAKCKVMRLHHDRKQGRIVNYPTISKPDRRDAGTL
jgi:hypothetical protein